MLIVLGVAFIVALAVAVLSSKNCMLISISSFFSTKIEFFSETQTLSGTQRIRLLLFIMSTSNVSKCKKSQAHIFSSRTISFCFSEVWSCRQSAIINNHDVWWSSVLRIFYRYRPTGMFSFHWRCAKSNINWNASYSHSSDDDHNINIYICLEISSFETNGLEDRSKFEWRNVDELDPLPCFIRCIFCEEGSFSQRTQVISFNNRSSDVALSSDIPFF